MPSTQVKSTSTKTKTKRSKTKSKKTTAASSSASASKAQVQELEQQMSNVEQNLTTAETKTKKSKKSKKSKKNSGGGSTVQEAAPVQEAEPVHEAEPVQETDVASPSASSEGSNFEFETTRDGVFSGFAQANSAFESILGFARNFHDNATARDYLEMRKSYSATQRLFNRINQVYQDYLLKHCQSEEKRALKRKSKDKKKSNNSNSGISQQHPLHASMVKFLNAFEQQRASQSGGDYDARTYTTDDTMSRVDGLKAVNAYIKLMALQEWPEDGRRFAVKHDLQTIFGTDRPEMIFTDIMGGLGPYFPSKKNQS